MTEGEAFFNLANDRDGWHFVDPDGQPFLSIGLNHIDDTNLMYPENVEVWERKYGSRRRWITAGVVADLRAWGFNTIGWTQEFVTGDFGESPNWANRFDIGHSREWSVTDFEEAGMPYCVGLRAAQIEDWNGNPIYPDVYSSEFDELCAYLARRVCTEHVDSRNLLGYFLVDIPAWETHSSGQEFPQLAGLKGGQRERRLGEIAQRYYDVLCGHIRARDPKHLILGDRYNGNKPIPAVVLEAAAAKVDVLSVQYFPEPSPEGRLQMRDDLARWHAEAGKPVLIADIGNWCQTEFNPRRAGVWADQEARAQDYVESLRAVVNEPWFLGWHWCAYVENFARGWGLKNPLDAPYRELVEPIRDFNLAAVGAS